MNSDGVFNQLFKISNISLIKTKKKLLTQVPKPYLKYAYDPFFQYGIKNVKPSGKGDRVFDNWTWRLLDVLRERKVTGNKARQVTATHMSTLTSRSATLLYNILQKDLRCGISTKRINEVFPNLIPELPIMLAEDYDKSRLILPCYSSLKLDGLRGIYTMDDMVSRSGKPHHGISHILKEIRLLKFSKLDGELIIPGKILEDQGAIRRKTETPLAEYHVFDVPSLAEFPFKMRYEILEERIKNTPLKYVKLIRHTIVNSWVHLQIAYNLAKANGYEGLVIKTIDHTYQARRSFDWMKIVPEKRGDYECIDVYEGKGKYINSLGGIIIRLPSNKTTKVGSGFSDDRRTLYFTSPEKIIGRTVEILFKERTRAGRLRHPRFVRIRYDK